MTIDTVLYNCKLYFGGELIEAGIGIDGGKIVKIAKDLNLPNGSTRINLNGNIILPGLIDGHVHLRDQQLAYKETFKTGTAAAAAGGVTSVIDMPNNNPVTMDSFSLKQRMKLAENQLLVNVGFNSAFPKDINEIPKIVEMGGKGFKVYLAGKIGGVNVDDDQSLVNAFQVASENSALILIHAEDREIIQTKKKEFEVSGQSNLMSYVKSHSPLAEAKSIRRIVSIIKRFDISVHFCHVSSKLGLDVILDAKKAGLPVTCEVTPHNLFLSDEQYAVSGSLALTDPPLRQQKDVASLQTAVKHGLVDIIASDHAPHAFTEKKADSIWQVPPGVPGLETTLVLLLNRINQGQLSFAELVRWTAQRPAVIFRLSNRGNIKEGNWADLVVVDLKMKHKIDSSLFFSKAKYSPFDDLQVKGKPTKTFVNGTLVMDDGQIVAKVHPGKLL
ncbi:MAG: dihydroorotase family protein [Candidatus Bathyarchaeota archaeon]|nr:MAG: dihydroorotase family protein [Candidatus Bathyarchaeota archaeon]